MKTENWIKIGDSYYAKGTKEAKARLAQFEATCNGPRVGMDDNAGKYEEGVCRNVQMRHTRSELNKTEQRYLQILQARFPFGHVQAHTIKLQLAEKCWYTPDFSYVLPTGALVFVETKGAFERDDAIVKLKTAARQFPQFTFIKAKYVKGKWTETVMPK